MKKFSNFLSMTLGSVLLAIGVYFFKIPNGFATGGVTGIGTVLARITPISPAVWIWMLNISLLFVGFIFLGKQNTFRT
ncbi:MAG: YitT family protein, partial [Clostridia bacterium]|nr:YitT family protein [Clostridia bacterium]